jgi:hypothetical protein
MSSQLITYILRYFLILSRNCSVGIVSRLSVKTRESDFDTQQKQKIFLDSVQAASSSNYTERSGVGWGGMVGKEVFPCGCTSRSVNLTTHLHLETNLKMHGAIFAFPRVPA